MYYKAGKASRPIIPKNKLFRFQWDRQYFQNFCQKASERLKGPALLGCVHVQIQVSYEKKILLWLADSTAIRQSEDMLENTHWMTWFCTCTLGPWMYHSYRSLSVDGIKPSHNLKGYDSCWVLKQFRLISHLKFTIELVSWIACQPMECSMQLIFDSGDGSELEK